MLHKLCMIFGLGTEKTKNLPEPDSDMCLVKIQLSGRSHKFYQDIGFIDILNDALKTPPTGGFLKYACAKGGYFINLSQVDIINISDVYEIKNGDSIGYSVFLSGCHEPVELGELSDEQVDLSFEQLPQFIRLGNYHFNRDQVSLIVYRVGKNTEG